MESANRRRDFVLGMVFFGGIALLLYYTIVLTGFSFRPKTMLIGRFPDARGLKEGDAVHVAGRPTGTVREVTLDYERPRDRRIGVVMEFSEAPLLREGYAMRIAEFTALGGRVIEIDPGPPGARPLEVTEELLGFADPGALELVREVIEENREGLRSILSNLREATDAVAAGQGVLGALVKDEGMREDLERILDDLRQTAADVRSGKGTLGALIHDVEMRERVSQILDDAGASIADLREVARQAREGEGLLGALLNDPQMREDAERLLENLDATAVRLREFADGAAEGRGLLGRVLNDPELAANASAFLEDLAEVSRRLKEGEGSLGRLLAKEEAYQQLMQALKSLNAQLEDAREAQPVSTFAGMLFGSF